MEFLGFLWAVVGHWQVLLAVGIAVLAALAYGYFRGTPALLKIVLDLRTWLLIGFVVLGLSVSSLSSENKKLTDRLDTVEKSVTAKDDAIASLNKRLKAKDRRATETRTLDEAIANAEPEQAQDAVLDAIAAIQSGRPAPDREPGPDGVRHPDGTIEP